MTDKRIAETPVEGESPAKRERVETFCSEPLAPAGMFMGGGPQFGPSNEGEVPYEAGLYRFDPMEGSSSDATEPDITELEATPETEVASPISPTFARFQAVKTVADKPRTWIRDSTGKLVFSKEGQSPYQDSLDRLYPGRPRMQAEDISWSDKDGTFGVYRHDPNYDGPNYFVLDSAPYKLFMLCHYGIVV